MIEHDVIDEQIKLLERKAWLRARVSKIDWEMQVEVFQQVLGDERYAEWLKERSPLMNEIEQLGLEVDLLNTSEGGN